MSAELPVFSKEEMDIEEAQGFPNAYAWLCSNSLNNGPFANGPPPSFIPQGSSETMVLKAVDLNRPLRYKPSHSASRESFQNEEDAANNEPQRFRSSISKENNKSALGDSSRKRNEARKYQEEISRLVGELNKLKQQNDIEETKLRELEAELKTTRIRVEKFRHLSEIQAYYRSLLETMIRDGMHQAIVYKKDIAQNEAASQVLLARLEAQRADCDSSESKLSEIYKERDKLKIRALVCTEQASKRSEVYDDCHVNNHHLSLKSRVRNPIRKELREFLKEEQNAFEESFAFSFVGKENSKEKSKVTTSIITEESDHCQSSTVHKIEDDIPLNSKLEEFAISDESYKRANGKKKQFLDHCSSSYNVEEGNGKLLVSKDHDMTFNKKLKEIHDSKLNVIMPPVEQKEVGKKQKQAQKSALDGVKTNNSQRQWNLQPSSHKQPEETEEYRYLVGKNNAEKWRQIFLENAKEGSSCSYLHSTPRNFDEKLNNVNAEIKINEVELCTSNNGRENNFSNKLLTERRFKEKSMVGTSESAWNVASRGKKRFDVEEKEKRKKGLLICESSSSRGCKPLPSSPSMIFGLRKSVDCIRKKPMVISDDKNAHEKAIFKNKNMITNIISRITKKKVKK